MNEAVAVETAFIMPRRSASVASGFTRGNLVGFREWEAKSDYASRVLLPSFAATVTSRIAGNLPASNAGLGLDCGDAVAPEPMQGY